MCSNTFPVSIAFPVMKQQIVHECKGGVGEYFWGKNEINETAECQGEKLEYEWCTEISVKVSRIFFSVCKISLKPFRFVLRPGPGMNLRRLRRIDGNPANSSVKHGPNTPRRFRRQKISVTTPFVHFSVRVYVLMYTTTKNPRTSLAWLFILLTYVNNVLKDKSLVLFSCSPSKTYPISLCIQFRYKQISQRTCIWDRKSHVVTRIWKLSLADWFLSAYLPLPENIYLLFYPCLKIFTFFSTLAWKCLSLCLFVCISRVYEISS